MLPTSKRKAVSTLVSSVLLIAVAAGATTGLIVTTSPLADSLGETRTIRTMLERMPELGDQIESVADMDEGSRQEAAISFSDGNLRVFSGRNEVEFAIETDSTIITPRSSRRFGNVRMSAGAEVFTEELTFGDKDVYRVGNEHIQMDILDIPRISDKVVGLWTLDHEGTEIIDDETERRDDGEVFGDYTWRGNCPTVNCLHLDNGYISLDV